MDEATEINIESLASKFFTMETIWFAFASETQEMAHLVNNYILQYASLLRTQLQKTIKIMTKLNSDVNFAKYESIAPFLRVDNSYWIQKYVLINSVFTNEHNQKFATFQKKEMKKIGRRKKNKFAKEIKFQLIDLPTFRCFKKKKQSVINAKELQHSVRELVDIYCSFEYLFVTIFQKGLNKDQEFDFEQSFEHESSEKLNFGEEGEKINDVTVNEQNEEEDPFK